MEDLTKSQLILLTLFVSFVTSIATGIVTVTLLEQAPVAVTQTVNRVVERTVERIVPGETKTTVREVVVTNDDLVAKIVAENKGAVVEIGVIQKEEPLGRIGEEKVVPGHEQVVLGTGVVVDLSGIVVISKVALSSVTTGMEARFSDNTKAVVTLVDFSHPSLAVLKINSFDAKKMSHIGLASRSLQLGEPLVGLGYHAGRLAVEVGRVVAMEDATNASSTPFAKSDVGSPWPVLSSKGSLVGFNMEDRSIVSSVEIIRLVDESKTLLRGTEERKSGSETASVGGAIPTHANRANP
ncbi:MAG: hypothetical protein COV10_01580 [Candidatus Vogelbacteria bacterium CG10_big_fil_rev_8_21_14_0_10_51_16]|uniref:Serine protease n=1 Tax=Candidatus Vogelbacteria bacterium CG10_big_fil_rev_8_21_14_0_10_51_16 TaxID=1975045 RepID=A0A2H0RGV4_9BACT|nr:MAG: hypothetical protein COV10_01580 [Candidatus Vogelbacteria bacterium CG10_big_fil_rev_8_21_14_0_10_51_16]